MELKRYPASAEGMVSSWVDRFPNTTVDDILEKLVEADKPHFAELVTLLDE